MQILDIVPIYFKIVYILRVFTDTTRGQQTPTIL